MSALPIAATEVVLCPSCGGAGSLPSPDPDPRVVTSRMPDQPCDTCCGTGEVTE